MIDGSNPTYRRGATQPEPLKVGHMQTAHAFGNIADRVGFRRVAEAVSYTHLHKPMADGTVRKCTIFKPVAMLRRIAGRFLLAN